MEDNKQNPGQDLSPEQVASISGGDGTSCAVPGGSSTVAGVGAEGPPGSALIAIYEGFVEVTSHVIERLVNTAR